MKKHLFLFIIALFSGKIFSQEFTITSEPIYNYSVDRYTNEIYYKQNYPNQQDVHKTNFDGSNNIKTDLRSAPFFANNSHKAVVLEWTGDDEISYFLFNFETSEKKYLFKTISRISWQDISFSWDDSLLYVYNDPLIYYSFKDSTLYEKEFFIPYDDNSPITWHNDNDRLIFREYNIIRTYSISSNGFDTLVVANGYDNIYTFSYNPNSNLLAYSYQRGDTNSIFTLNLEDNFKRTIFQPLYSDDSCFECLVGSITKMSWSNDGNFLAFSSKPFIDPHVENFYLYHSVYDTTYQYVSLNDGYTYQLKWLDKDRISYQNASNGYQLMGYKYDKPLSVEKVTSERVNVALSCYPNPFNTSTIIKYSIPSIQAGGGFVTLKIYDILGREVITLVNEKQNAGNYEVNFNAKNLSSGIYYYRLKSGSFVESKKMVLLK